MSLILNSVDICRGCMSSGEDLINFSAKSVGNQNFATKFSELLNVEILENDGLPTKICQKCIDKINNFYEFKKLVQATHKTLRQLISPIFTSSPLKDELRLCDELEVIPQGNDIKKVKENIKEELVSFSYETTFKQNTKHYINKPKTSKQKMIGNNGQKKSKVNLEQIKNNSNKTKEEAENSFNDSDSEYYSESNENILGSLNDAITKMKQVKSDGDKKKYQCTLCLENYDQLHIGLLHLVDFHIPSSGPFYCYACEADYSDIRILRSHVKTHKGPQPYKCFMCDRAYGKRVYLKRHMQSHEEFLAYRCPKCGERFREKAKLKDHVKSLHDKLAPYECNICSKVYHQKPNYKKHLLRHLDPKSISKLKYPCEICKKRFINNRSLKLHIRVHTGEKPYKCDICSKVFSQNGNLQNHYKTHTNPRNFTCEVCGRNFNHKSVLKDHSLIHSNELKNICNICGKAFRFISALKRHMWNHVDSKPFVCDVCNKSFRGKFDIRRHLKTHEDNGKSKCKQKVNNQKQIIEVPVKELVFVPVTEEITKYEIVTIDQSFPLYETASENAVIKKLDINDCILSYGDK